MRKNVTVSLARLNTCQILEGNSNRAAEFHDMDTSYRKDVRRVHGNVVWALGDNKFSQEPKKLGHYRDKTSSLHTLQSCTPRDTAVKT